jgi:hypothetical protein
MKVLGQDRVLDRSEEREWMPIANSAVSIRGIATVLIAKPCQASTRPVPPTSMIKISQNLTIRMIFALSRMSASWPASADSTKNGMMNSVEAIALNFASSASEL